MLKLKNTLLLALISALIFTSCTNDDVTDISQTQVTNTIQSGTWRVTYFNDNGVDETANYNGYTFAFNTNGTATATRNAASTNGTWASGTDDSKVKLILFFGTASPLDELDEDWRVLERTDTKIRLEHISGGNGGVDFLTFEKI